MDCVRDFSVPFGSVLAKALADHPFVAMDEATCGGAPRIANTRIPIYMVIEAVCHFGNIEAVMSEYPSITISMIKDALMFAADVMEHRV